MRQRQPNVSNADNREKKVACQTIIAMFLFMIMLLFIYVFDEFQVDMAI